MTKNDITEVMLDEWISEMREVFRDNPKSMNLIAKYIRIIDDPDKEDEQKERVKKGLRSFYENHLAHKGLLECEYCGSKMEVYYEVKCFHCKEAKPGPNKDNHYNLIMAMNYVNNVEEDFDYDNFWTELVNDEQIKGNDTLCKLNDSKSNNMELFKKHYEIEGVVWEVSW
jgi:hypothetical protein